MIWPFASQYPLLSVEQIGDEYDYIIVGAGSAGCVVASRLSEDPSLKVLLLERGEFNNEWFTRIPLTSMVSGRYMVRKPTETGPAIRNRKQDVFAAETVGGTTRLNGMIYTRGVPAYYHRWAQSGYDNWDWPMVEPYFRKVERRDAVGANTTSSLSSGMVHLRQYEPMSGVYGALRRSAEALGLRAEAGLNHPAAPAAGYYNLDLAIDRKGYRHSADRAYLPYDLAFQRRNHLHICPGALVVRLDIQFGADNASGVVMRPTSSSMPEDCVRIKAKCEIIVCAGVIATPQILQLSGIGPPSLLHQHGIPVVIDLPGVGSHLMDHCAFPVWVDVASHDTHHPIMSNPLQALKHFILFGLFGSGWFKSSIERAIFFNTAHLEAEMRVSNAESALDSSRTQNIPNVEVLILPVISEPDVYPDHSSITFLTMLNQPFSTGTVMIKSNDSCAYPTICLGMLSDPRDKKVARDGLRFSLRLADHFINQSGYPYPSSVFAGPGTAGNHHGWKDVSDEDLDDYIERHITSTHHLTSSCRMGKRQDGGVVDHELRVHGLRNVRIADASVLPTVTPAHPMAAVYMLAERCADFVKAAGGMN
ncbi:Oxygen-dependent choline dehydrogenase [Paramyrothecium foliicola]|nr:Oxygen-dependent choline dehydrogenase [Paramyrothecium foliicola]